MGQKAYIPKGDGSKRPLGIPTIEDKVLQAGVRKVLEPIYEREFKDYSYAFRPNRSTHQAIDYMTRKIEFGGIRYIIDADLKNYFGSISHVHLREFVTRRVSDGEVKKMIDKWMKAGILEEGMVTYPEEGTPQGGIISPLLSNIYLHYGRMVHRANPTLVSWTQFYSKVCRRFYSGIFRQEGSRTGYGRIAETI